MGLEIELDKLLKIKTNGRDDTNSNFINYPYEPTPYCVLQTLSNSGYIKRNDTIVDYGCGKGRVDFFLAYSNKATMIGVEYDERLFNRALDNLETAVSKNRVSFVNICASKYIVPDEVSCAYFFNPFSLDILKEVINNLFNSLQNKKREIKLFFYYPSKEYIEFLNNEEKVTFISNISCVSLFKEEDLREYIAVYKM